MNSLTGEVCLTAESPSCQELMNEAITLEIFRGAYRSAICTRFSTFRIYRLYNKIMEATRRSHTRS
jgi:hypothetical protein